MSNSALRKAERREADCCSSIWIRWRAVCHCTSASFTSAPAFSKLCWKVSKASSCCALAIFRLAMFFPRLKRGCTSEPTAESNHCPGLEMTVPVPLVHPADPLKVGTVAK
jgi:hypothetical protein